VSTGLDGGVSRRGARMSSVKFNCCSWMVFHAQARHPHSPQQPEMQLLLQLQAKRVALPLFQCDTVKMKYPRVRGYRRRPSSEGR